MKFVVLFLMFVAVSASKPNHHHLNETTTSKKSDRVWQEWAIKKLWRLKQEYGETPLLKLKPPFAEGKIVLYLKNEGKAITGSLKLRFAWALYMWAIIEGKVKNDTTVYEASSGNTALGEAYFCQKLGLNFIVYVRNGTSELKIAHLKTYDAEVRISNDIVKAAANAAKTDPTGKGFFMNQFANAQVALDYFEGSSKHSSMNDAEEFLEQMKYDEFPIPKWFVMCAGTGGTLTSVGRYLKRNGYDTKVALVDEYYSNFYNYVTNKTMKHLKKGEALYIEGTGAYGPHIEFAKTTSLLKQIVDKAFEIDEVAAVASIHFLEHLIVYKAGISTGLNFYGALKLAQEMHSKGENGSIVTLIPDDGKRYAGTFWNMTYMNSSKEYKKWWSEKAYNETMKIVKDWWYGKKPKQEDKDSEGEDYHDDSGH